MSKGRPANKGRPVNEESQVLAESADPRAIPALPARRGQPVRQAHQDPQASRERPENRVRQAHVGHRGLRGHKALQEFPRRQRRLLRWRTMMVLRQGDDEGAIVYAINDLKSEFQEFVKEMRSARNEAVEDRIDMAGRISALETKSNTHSKLMWAFGGALGALAIEAIVFFMLKVG